MELIASGLNFPTSLSFNAEGHAYVAEAGLGFDGAKPGGRVLRLEPDGSHTLLLDSLRSPVNGLTCHDSDLLISEGGNPGRISRLSPTREWTILLDGLPGMGNYHTNMAAVGPDKKVYFSQGAMTNSGIIGLDAYELGWLRRLPHDHDIPGHEVVLNGIDIETANPLPGQSLENGAIRARTGAFSPFNTPTTRGQRIAAKVPCTAAVLRCNPDGSELELVAWGLRNAYGLGFLPDGRLLALDQGADDRGSRPIGNAPDLLFHVTPGQWYGWPDYVGGVPVTDPRFRPERGQPPELLLDRHDELPPVAQPLLEFPINAAATKFDIAPTGRWKHQLFVALFGDEKPMTAPPGSPAGRCLARIDPQDWSLHPVLAGPFHRPIDVRFHPKTQDLWVVDFGEFEMDEQRKVHARAGSGKVWSIPRAEYEATFEN